MKNWLNTLSGSLHTVPRNIIPANTAIRPGVREHILFSRDRYATNTFMESFRRNVNFAWPHDLQSTYKLDPESELYGFTSLYLHHQSRIECWQMNPDFFSQFPEFRADIPASSLSICQPLNRRLDFGLSEAVIANDEDNASPGDTSFQRYEMAHAPSVVSVS
jgi:hypothetical protein